MQFTWSMCSKCPLSLLPNSWWPSLYVLSFWFGFSISTFKSNSEISVSFGLDNFTYYNIIKLTAYYIVDSEFPFIFNILLFVFPNFGWNIQVLINTSVLLATVNLLTWWTHFHPPLSDVRLNTHKWNESFIVITLRSLQTAFTEADYSALPSRVNNGPHPL